MLVLRFAATTCLAALLATGCQNKTPPSAKKPATSAAPVAGQPAPNPTPTAAPARRRPEKLVVRFLPNAYRIHEKVISGGQPAGEPAFKELADLGVKTVISVDGATPDVAAAKKYGLRYVHLPHGYDGVPEDRAKELAKAVRDLPGAVYIHCHHGKHRSPAASAVACVSAGLLDPALAETVLTTAGTSEGYRGLYASARGAKRFDDKLLDELQAEFPETAKIPPLAAAMVELEHTHDHLKSVEAAGWKSPPDHPDIDPAHEALLLREHFTEMLRTDAVKEQPEGFQVLLRTSEVAAQELETALRYWKDAGMKGSPPAAAAQAFERVTAQCKACHTTYRDVPLGQKGK
jgi:protein tyrosine phosphatase (PTP) superfamily phosphohydrolase (DUF442 family)